MVFNSGTSTDYLDLLDDLIATITARALTGVAINAGGTGHAVGDVIDIDATGATSTLVARLEVTSVSSGVIDGVRIFRGGAYTVDPTTTTGNAQSATTGSGISATFDLTFSASEQWTQLARESEAASAVVSAGGTGYTNGSTDVLTVVGGVLAPGGAAATFTATVSGGIVTSVALLSAGDYEVIPSNPAVTTVAPSGGSGCTLTVTWSEVSGDTIVVLQGDGGTAEDPLVGIKTYSDELDETGLNSVYNWALFGMSSWSSSTNLHQQASISPGFSSADDGDTTLSASGDGAFVPLKDSDAFNISWWLTHTGRRVVLIAKVESATTTYYAHAKFGLLNPYGITTELPFPMCVAGSSDRPNAWYKDTASIWGGLSEVIQRNNGPMFCWAPDGEWINCANATISANNDTTPSYSLTFSPRAYVQPLGTPLPHTTNDQVIWGTSAPSGFDTADLTLTSSPAEIYPTPNTGDDLIPLFPVTVLQADPTGPTYRIFGEIDGVFWLHDGGLGISSEDRIQQGAAAYLIFQNGTRINPYSFLALRED